jgi:dihydrofolate synthase/folylpolyglutamate synthase
MHPDALAVAEEVAAQRGATIVQAEADPHAVVGALGTFQRRNFALARAAAEAFLGKLDEAAVVAAAADVRVPGRLQIVDQHPLTLLDGAHNPDGIAALTESLPEIVASARTDDGRVVAVVSILDDKDAVAMLSSLAPLCDALVLTSSHNPRVLPPPTLSSLLDQLAPAITIAAEIVREPHSALRRARELAGPGGVVIAAGSLYLISDLMHDEATAGGRRASML